MDRSDLPHLDEHATEVGASADDLWAVLLDSVDTAFSRPGASVYARAVGCADTAVSGPRPLAEGSAFPGFRVTRAVAPAELVLQGRHRFSTYALVFRIDAVAPGRSRLRAESRAVFPGLLGGAYRLLVIGSRGHVVIVRRMLAGIRRRAERAAVA